MMSLIAKGNDSNFELVPEGTHTAVCNMVVGLGSQDTEWMGQKSIKEQCYIRWEIPAERIEYQDKNGNQCEGPRVIGRTYTFSLFEKANLRHDLEGWRGKAFTPEELEGFDVFNVLGAPCLITVTHRKTDNGTYANVTGVASLVRGMEKPKAENSLIKFSNDDQEQWDDLPEWLQNKINTAVPTGFVVGSPQDPQAPPELDDTDQIPF